MRRIYYLWIMGVKTSIFLCCALFFSCASQQNTAAKIQEPTEMGWALLELNGKSVDQLAETASSAYILLDKENNKLSGSTGCNQLLGSYQISENNQIKFSKIGMTKRGCAGADYEMEFAQAIEESQTFQINADTLIFMDGEGNIRLKMMSQEEGLVPTTEP